VRQEDGQSSSLGCKPRPSFRPRRRCSSQLRTASSGCSWPRGSRSRPRSTGDRNSSPSWVSAASTSKFRIWLIYARGSGAAASWAVLRRGFGQLWNRWMPAGSHVIDPWPLSQAMRSSSLRCGPARCRAALARRRRHCPPRHPGCASGSAPRPMALAIHQAQSPVVCGMIFWKTRNPSACVGSKRITSVLGPARPGGFRAQATKRSCLR